MILLRVKMILQQLTLCKRSEDDYTYMYGCYIKFDQVINVNPEDGSKVALRMSALILSYVNL
jgi:hypothetical protein